LLESAKIIALWVPSSIGHRSSLVSSYNTCIKILVLVLASIKSVIVECLVVVIDHIAVCLGIVVFGIERRVNFHIFKLNFKLLQLARVLISNLSDLMLYKN
jgi:hypothetical protein